MSRNRLGSSDLMKLLSAGAASIAGKAKIVLRTNVTPDITINVDSLMKAKGAAPPPGTVSSEDEMALKILQPEITLRMGGQKQMVFAPHGKPRGEYLLIFFGVLLLSGIVGARVAWSMCKKD